MEYDGFFVLTFFCIVLRLILKYLFYIFITINKIIKYSFILKVYIFLPIIRVILCVGKKPLKRSIFRLVCVALLTLNITAKPF